MPTCKAWLKSLVLGCVDRLTMSVSVGSARPLGGLWVRAAQKEAIYIWSSSFFLRLCWVGPYAVKRLPICIVIDFTP